MASGDGQEPGQALDAVERVERSRLSAAEASWALRDVNRAAAEVDQVLARRLGLRPLDYAAMSHLMSGADALGPQELSTRLGISTGSTTELVDRLERAGHVERRRGHRDRRRVGLHPTETAVARILSELDPVLTGLAAVAGDFSADELAVVTRYLRRAAAVLRAYEDEAPALPGDAPARGP